MELISQLLKHKKQEPDQKEWHQLNNHWKFPFLLKARQKGWWDGLVRRKIGTLDPITLRKMKIISQLTPQILPSTKGISIWYRVKKRGSNGQKILTAVYITTKLGALNSIG